MAGLKETPRQKMMGILYLVLLGLAATTVTDHVLDAFRNLTVSLETSSKNVKATVDNSMSAFEATKLKNEPERAKPIWAKAKRVKSAIANLDKYINDLKEELVKEGGGRDPETGEVGSRENIDISPRIMVRKGKAKELKKKIDDTRNLILKELDAVQGGNIKLALSAQDPPKRRGGVSTTWEESNFGDGIPLTAALTALTKVQADMRNTEADAIKKILGDVDKAVINLDRFEAVAVAPTSYVLVGQQYEASVFLTASDSKADPEVTVGGQKLKVDQGKGLYKVTTSREGEFKWSGTIKVKQADGTMKEYKTKEQVYTVARPSAVVSPDKMNVFYIGVPNPVSVSAPGFSKDKIRVSISEGEIKGSGTNYEVNVKKTGTVKVTVSGIQEGGKTTVLGVSEFRTKRIPPPRVKFGGKSGGRLPTGAMKAQNRIFAILEDFEFDAKFTIQHFTMYIFVPRGEPMIFEGNSNKFTPEMSAGMQKVTSGARVTFDNVFATGPDGMRRQLDPITFAVQ